MFPQIVTLTGAASLYAWMMEQKPFYSIIRGSGVE